jgi:signal transduction histidine kinase
MTPNPDLPTDPWATIEIDPPPSDPAEHGSWLAHELRTPLTVLAGYLDGLVEDEADDQEYVLARMSHAGDRLLQLADVLTAAQQRR